MTPPSTYFRHSGRFTPQGLLLMALAAGGVAPALGVVYGYLVAINPLIYVNFLATLCCALGVGFAVGFAARLGKVRNWKLTGVFALLGGLALFYAQWWATLRAYGAPTPFDQPAAFWPAALALADSAPWTLRGHAPGSGVLLTVWSVEAAILVGGAALVGFGSLTDPFCEKCGVWAVARLQVAPLDSVGDGEQLRARVERGDLGALRELDTVQASPSYASIKLISCPKCSELRVATVEQVDIQESKGERKENRHVVLENVLIDAATWDAIAKRVGGGA